MKVKKNPSNDLNRNSGIYFAAGMALVLALTYVALEWKTFYGEKQYNTAMLMDEDLSEEVELVVLTPPLPPPPTPVIPDIIEIIEDDVPIEDSVIKDTESDEEKEVMEVEEVEYAEVEEEVKVNWITIEEVPIFPGCENAEDKRSCFQEKMNKHIGKVFEYPDIAQEMGIEGRVFTQFTIEKDGTIGEILLRGPDKSLEKEAERIIEKLPKMTPGKQRDQNVKVSFSIPITFKLN